MKPLFFALALFSCAMLSSLFPNLTAAQAQHDLQSYPLKPIRLIVPWAPGGSTDIVARVIAEKLADSLNQPIVVDNRPGANGIIGSAIAAKAPPDGYTMVLHATGHTLNPSIRSRLPYDTLKDFAGVTMLGAQPLVLVVSSLLPVKSVKELAELAKADPKKLAFGSWGEGSPGHLAGELMKSMGGFDMLHVPYKGSSAAIVDIMGGRLQLMFVPIPNMLTQLKTGKLRALAVPSTDRVPILPDVPTMIESGYPNFVMEAWRAMYVPAGTPKSIVYRLNSEILKVVREKEVKERFLAMNFYLAVSTPEELDTFTRLELEKTASIVRRAGVRRIQ